MQIYNALDLKAGKKTEYNKMLTLQQPIQFLTELEKDDNWKASNLDWLEWQGMKQLRRNSVRLLKNYKLAKGIIDKTDYIVQEDNPNADLIEILTKEDESAFELKFYPIIPNVINVLCSEFSKRASRIMFRTVDDLSYNEMLEEKKDMIEQVLMQKAQSKMTEKLVGMGMDPNSDEFKQEMTPEKLKSLPEIEGFFKKSYRNIYEEWATHQHQVDTERFHIDELEERAFRDMLITDREFWHFRMGEDDYDIELWNPVQVFYHKSASSRYISESHWIGNIDLLTVADVIDKYGWMMNEEQLISLENIYPSRSAGYLVPGMQNDGSYYDSTKSHDWNTQGPGLAYRQFMSTYDATRMNGDIVQMILNESEDLMDWGNTHLLRCTTVYWKSQRRVGHLTKITELGELIQDIVVENYKITDKPLYDNTLYKEKSKDNLVFGEHIDWIWINETYGGIKVGPNRPVFLNGNTSAGSLDPLYLGLNGGKPGRIPFQFKGDTTLYGCKPPVEGAVFSDRNTRSVAMVDLMKPFQLGYNMVNNQIADILIDELGTIIVFDQNALPRHSMGEDWGKNNLSNAYLAMKNFQMLPLDTSISNTENALNFQHYQSLDLEQSKRLMSRIQLANYFKQQAFESIGVTLQRMGQQISQETATGAEQALNASYNQTEIYFVQHSDNLMPRVHQMRTELAQYYNSTKSSIRLQYITTADEKVNFQLNGTDLLLRDLNIFCTTKTNTRAIMDQLKSLAINNNTTGASIYDLGNIIKADSMAELTNVLKSSEEKANAIRQQEQQHQQELQQQQQQAAIQQEQMRQKFEAEQNDKNRETKLLGDQIKAAGMGAGVDINQNQISDYQDAMAGIQKQQNYIDTTNFKREQEANKTKLGEQKLNMEKQKMQSQQEIANKQLEIARENKNKYDVKTKNNKK